MTTLAVFESCTQITFLMVLSMQTKVHLLYSKHRWCTVCALGAIAILYEQSTNDVT